MNLERYREDTEEAGLEGLRHLMGPIELPNGGKINTEDWVRSDGTWNKLKDCLKNNEPKLLEGEGQIG